MEKEGSDFEATPFSYQILDDEAAKISGLVLAVQQKCLQPGQFVAQELFSWAQACELEGRKAEAEFLYLHCINLCQPNQCAVYPFIFRSLREYAARLVERCCSQIVGGEGAEPLAA